MTKHRVTIEFNLNKESDRLVYNWLLDQENMTFTIKDLLLRTIQQINGQNYLLSRSDSARIDVPVERTSMEKTINNLLTYAQPTYSPDTRSNIKENKLSDSLTPKVNNTENYLNNKPTKTKKRKRKNKNAEKKTKKQTKSQQESTSMSQNKKKSPYSSEKKDTKASNPKVQNSQNQQEPQNHNSDKKDYGDKYDKDLLEKFTSTENQFDFKNL